MPLKRLAAPLPSFTSLTADAPTGGADRLPRANIIPTAFRFDRFCWRVLRSDVSAETVKADGHRYNLGGYVAGYEEADRNGGEHLLVMLLDGSDVAGMCEGWWDAGFPDRVSQ